MKTCLGCGRLNPANADACAKCGAPLLASDAKAPAGAARAAPPRAAVPSPLAKPDLNPAYKPPLDPDFKPIAKPVAKPVAPVAKAPPPPAMPVPPVVPLPPVDHIELVPLAATVEVIEVSDPNAVPKAVTPVRPVVRRIPVPQDETAPAPLDPEVAAMEAARNAGPAQLLGRLRGLASGKGKVMIAAALGAVAVVGVAAGLAVPAYQDHAYQAKVAEIMGEAKAQAAKASEEFARTGAFPTRLDLPSIVRRELEAMRIDPQTGVIEVNMVFGGRTGSVYLVPELSNGQLGWQCTATPDMLKLAGKGCTPKT